MGENIVVNLNQFIQQRRPRWDRLSALLDHIAQTGAESLSTAETDEFFSLYRLTSSDLSMMQTHGGNPALLDFLEMLVARAYQYMAVPHRSGFFRAWWRIIRCHFPATVRRQWAVVVLSAAIMLAGTVAGYTITAIRPSAVISFVPQEFFRQNPAQLVHEKMHEQSNGNFHLGAGENIAFSVFLFTHNIEVSIFCFALGMTFGVGTLIMLFFNGLMCGSLAERFASDGVMTYFISWVGPHGSLELPAICIAASAGMIIARAQWTRGGRCGGVLSAIRAQRQDMLNLLVGAATMLIAAGAIEGGFSQLTEPVIPYWLKITLACVLFAGLLFYLFIMPIDEHPTQDEPPSVLSEQTSEKYTARWPAWLRRFFSRQPTTRPS